MSSLIVLTKNNGSIHFQKEVIDFYKKARNPISYNQIGISWFDGESLAHDVFPSLKTFFIAFEKIQNIQKCIIYLNQEEYFLSASKEHSPIIEYDKNGFLYSFAACGDIYDYKTLQNNISDIAHFNKKVLHPLFQRNQNSLISNYAKWLIENTARSYVGMALLTKNGESVIFNENCFDKHEESEYTAYSCNFETNKARHYDKFEKAKQAKLAQRHLGCQLY